MRRIYFCSFSVALFLASFASVNAQEKTTVSTGQNTESVNGSQPPVDRLGLKKEQQIPYREIIKRYAMLARDVRKSSLSKEEKMIKMKELETNKDTEIKNVLSSDQFKVYQEMREENKAKFLDMRKK